jgi:hypothetical protein
MGFEPALLCEKGLATKIERSQIRTAYGRQIRPPSARRVRLDLAGTPKCKETETREVEHLRVEATNASVLVNH